MAKEKTRFGSGSLRGSTISEEQETGVASTEKKGEGGSNLKGEELPVSPAIFKSDGQTEAFLYGTGKPMDRVKSAKKRESMRHHLDASALTWKDRRQAVRSTLLSNPVQVSLCTFDAPVFVTISALVPKRDVLSLPCPTLNMYSRARSSSSSSLPFFSTMFG